MKQLTLLQRMNQLRDDPADTRSVRNAAVPNAHKLHLGIEEILSHVAVAATKQLEGLPEMAKGYLDDSLIRYDFENLQTDVSSQKPRKPHGTEFFQTWKDLSKWKSYLLGEDGRPASYSGIEMSDVRLRMSSFCYLVPCINIFGEIFSWPIPVMRSTGERQLGPDSASDLGSELLFAYLARKEWRRVVWFNQVQEYRIASDDWPLGLEVKPEWPKKGWGEVSRLLYLGIA